MFSRLPLAASFVLLLVSTTARADIAIEAPTANLVVEDSVVVIVSGAMGFTHVASVGSASVALSGAEDISGTLSLVGVASGPATIDIKTFSGTLVGSVPIIIDRKPKVVIEAPIGDQEVSGSVHVKAHCTDDIACTVVTNLGSTPVGDSIDATFSMPATDPTVIAGVVVTATDSRGQTAVKGVTVNAEVLPQAGWEEILHTSSTILGYDGAHALSFSANGPAVWSPSGRKALLYSGQMITVSTHIWPAGAVVHVHPANAPSDDTSSDQVWFWNGTDVAQLEGVQTYKARGRYMVTNGDGGLRIRNMASGAELYSTSASAIYEYLLGPSGDVLMSISGVRAWWFHNGQLIDLGNPPNAGFMYNLDLNKDSVAALSLRSQSSAAFTWDESGTVHMLCETTGDQSECSPPVLSHASDPPDNYDIFSGRHVIGRAVYGLPGTVDHAEEDAGTDPGSANDAGAVSDAGTGGIVDAGSSGIPDGGTSGGGGVVDASTGGDIDSGASTGIDSGLVFDGGHSSGDGDHDSDQDQDEDDDQDDDDDKGSSDDCAVGFGGSEGRSGVGLFAVFGLLAWRRRRRGQAS